MPGVGRRRAAGGDRRGADTVRCIQRPAQPRPARRAGEVIVSVEAKADETFGETIGEYRAAANARRERGEGTKAPERLEGLLAALVPPGASAPDSLRYQLFSATAGALAEAQGARAAVVVIHEFVTPATSPAKRKANSADLRAFLMELFGANRRERRSVHWAVPRSRK